MTASRTYLTARRSNPRSISTPPRSRTQPVSANMLRRRRRTLPDWARRILRPVQHHPRQEEAKNSLQIDTLESNTRTQVSLDQLEHGKPIHHRMKVDKALC